MKQVSVSVPGLAILEIIGHWLGTCFQDYFKFLVNQEYKALVSGLHRNFLVEPGILGKTRK